MIWPVACCCGEEVGGGAVALSLAFIVIHAGVSGLFSGSILAQSCTLLFAGKSCEEEYLPRK